VSRSRPFGEIGGRPRSLSIAPESRSPSPIRWPEPPSEGAVRRPETDRPIARRGPSMRPGCDLERRQRCRTSHLVAVHSITCRDPNMTACSRFHTIA
jgi:hypothetical protein